MAGYIESSTKEFVHDLHPGRELSLTCPAANRQIDLLLQDSFTLKSLYSQEKNFPMPIGNYVGWA
jgi:hypothetical protein